MPTATMQLPTHEQVVNFDYPADSPIRLVSTSAVTKDGRKVVDGLHPITLAGRLACECDMNPNDFFIYGMNGVHPKHRHLICEEGFDYLRVFVAREYPEALQVGT